MFHVYSHDALPFSGSSAAVGSDDAFQLPAATTSLSASADINNFVSVHTPVPTST